MTFKEKSKIEEETLFYDIELETDNKQFVDPYLIYKSDDELSEKCSNKIVGFFDELLRCAREKDHDKACYMVKYLQENNEVRFGYSMNGPRGKGLGYNKGDELYEMLCSSRAVTTGLVSDIFDSSILLENVGADKISDFTINIILQELIEFTQEQCLKYNIAMEETKLRRPTWDSETNEWISGNKIFLPTHGGKPIILVPKRYVNEDLVYNYQNFYNDQMIPYYEREVMIHPSHGLVKILKRGIVPARTKIRKQYPCLKENVIDFILTHPEEYENFKNKKIRYAKL